MAEPNVALDPLQLPAPTVVENISYEVLLAARMASLQGRFAAAGIDYDVGALETDPAKLLQEEDAYRQMLDRQRVNDALRAVLPAYAQGTDLDAIALRAGVVRLFVEERQSETGTTLVYETDARLLRRYLAAFARPAAGSIDAYIYAVLTALPTLHDVAVLGPAIHGRAGRVDIVLLAPPGRAIGNADIEIARLAVNERSARPLTDYVTIRAATLVDYAVNATLYIPSVPDADVVRQAALASVQTLAALRYRIGIDGGVLAANALAAAVYVPNVVRVVLSAPMADIPIAPDAVPRLTAANLTVTVMPL